MFGTNDVIYVPAGQPLVFDDVYRWKRFKIDIDQLGLRIRPGAFEEVATKMRAALEIVRHSPRFVDSAMQISQNTDGFLRDLATHAGAAEEPIQASFAERLKANQASWWLRISDLPGESFFEEDYERRAKTIPNPLPHHTYGSVSIAQLDGLDVPLSGDDEDGSPFSIDTPENGGVTRWSIVPTEPLALVHEYCGEHGASANGRTVNVSTLGELTEAHQFCTPMARLGSLYVTLYFHYIVGSHGRVIGRIPETALEHYLAVVKHSGFALANEGPTWRIFQRDGDVLHFYSGLAGKEVEGVETIPPFMLVTRSGDSDDPLLRAELFEAVRDAAKNSAG